MIDVIVPNYNGVHLLPTCLDALRRQTRRDFAVTVVDDHSTDGSLELLRTRYPEVRVLALERNVGFAAAVNRGIAATCGSIVVLLNSDTEADDRWLEELVGALERYPAYSFAASKLRLFDRREVLHSAGDGYALDGVPFSRGVWEQDRGQYDALSEVFGPCAGAAAYRREALLKLADDQGHIFDESLLFMYCEDVDLNVRARRAGLRTLFVPSAVVYHRLSATGGGPLASYYVGRNCILVWVKNMPAGLLLRGAPAFLGAQLNIALAALRNIRGAAARARLRGQLAALLLLPQAIRSRAPISGETARLRARMRGIALL